MFESLLKYLPGHDKKIAVEVATRYETLWKKYHELHRKSGDLAESDLQSRIIFDLQDAVVEEMKACLLHFEHTVTDRGRKALLEDSNRFYVGLSTGQFEPTLVKLRQDLSTIKTIAGTKYLKGSLNVYWNKHLPVHKSEHGHFKTHCTEQRARIRELVMSGNEITEVDENWHHLYKISSLLPRLDITSDLSIRHVLHYYGIYR